MVARNDRAQGSHSKSGIDRVPRNCYASAREAEVTSNGYRERWFLSLDRESRRHRVTGLLHSRRSKSGQVPVSEFSPGSKNHSFLVSSPSPSFMTMLPNARCRVVLVRRRAPMNQTESPKRLARGRRLRPAEEIVLFPQFYSSPLPLSLSLSLFLRSMGLCPALRAPCAIVARGPYTFAHS